MIKQLLEYQNVDANLRKIEQELSSSEERKKAVVAKKYLETVNENVSKLEIRSAELVSLYEQAKNKHAQLQEQQAELSHAIDGLEDESGATFLLKKAEELVTEIKNVVEQLNRISTDIQNVIKEYANIKAKTKAATEQYNEYGAKYNELKASKKEEMDKISAELAKIRASADKELMERYDKKRAEKMFPIFVEANGNNCGACGMEFSMLAQTDLKNGKVIECDTCRKLIYMPNDND